MALGKNNAPMRILKVQSKINQLTGVLSRMVNLQRFFWNCARYKRYPDNNGSSIPEISEQLENIQRVFLELRCLYSLVIDGFIFDPHFFLRPPKGLREFRILWAMRQEWWKQFAKHPFVGLRSLFIHVETDQFFDLAEDVCKDCIVRNNPNLDEDSFRHMCYRRGASIAAKCFWKIDSRALAAAKILWSSLPGQYATGDDTADSLNSKAAKEYSRTAAYKSLNIMRRLLNGMAPQCAETFGDSLKRGYQVNIEDIVKEWIPKLVKMYEEDPGHNAGDVITIRDAQVPPGNPNLSEGIADVFYGSNYYY
ncbi:hypothetical protein TWF106_007397 [Orbilia oligospora]|uniref:Uncharacterized protein n=1 Tax=Orbilia oligospora TaxID=2813651 RepID=A0A6G1MDH5_ORBOL|nr:hypothetical protein TWF106_007397 [Orbilia oligospora]KAF3252938.1 hypothetical protein TWF192_004223 [Orbilia oligospora]